jgi:hypothetical protein
MAKDKKITTLLSPEAFVAMLLHAANNGTTVVHGILIGSFSSGKVTITKAIPVCHETPTKPLVETALALVAASTDEDIVGWYTAPEHLADTKPGPTALRIAANLATESEDSVLLLISNEGLGQCLRGDKTRSSVITALGRDFNEQWLEPLELNMTEEGKAMEAAKAAFSAKLDVPDLVDHWDHSTSTWFTNDPLAKLVAKHS